MLLKPFFVIFDFKPGFRTTEIGLLSQIYAGADLQPRSLLNLGYKIHDKQFSYPTKFGKYFLYIPRSLVIIASHFAEAKPPMKKSERK